MRRRPAVADDIINQLEALALCTQREYGKSTIYGAVREIEYLRDQVADLIRACREAGLEW